MYDRKKLAEKLRLYMICGEGDAPEAVIEKTRAALAGGVTAVQLRVKTWTGRETYETALKLKELCAARGALFFVNDRLDIALAAKADGVHLGQKDLPVDAARATAGPDFIIGGTARTPELAREAQRLGADYVGCGAAFGTATKGDAVVIVRRDRRHRAIQRARARGLRRERHIALGRDSARRRPRKSGPRADKRDKQKFRIKKRDKK